MTLDLYFVRRFACNFMVVVGVVFVLVITIDTIDILGSIRAESIGLLDAVWLSSLRVPDIIVNVFPLIVLISSLVFCLGLSRSSEFVIARAVGRPMLMTLRGPAIVAVLVSLFVTISFAPFSGRLLAQYDTARAQFSTNIESKLQVTSSGLWLREADGENITVLNASESAQNGTRLRNVTVFRFGSSGRLLERIEAENAFLSEGQLILSQAKLWDFRQLLNNPELSAQSRGLVRISTQLTAEQVLDGQPEPKTLFLWELPSKINDLERSGSSSLSHRTHLLGQLAMPVMYLAMFLIGALFTLETSRMGNRGLSVIGAVTLGFFLFFFQRTSQTFGEAGELALFAATWAPSLAAVFGGIAWLLRNEDG